MFILSFILILSSLIYIDVTKCIKYGVLINKFSFINNLPLNDRRFCGLYSKRSNDDDLDYYKILSLDRNCTIEEVEEKYKSINKLLSTMPSVDPKLKSSIDRAYNVLSNEDLRSKYDRRFENEDADEDEIELSIYDDEDDLEEAKDEDELDEDQQGNIWSRLFGFTTPKKPKNVYKKLQKSDLSTTLNLNLKSFVFGDVVTIPIDRWKLCNNCNPDKKMFIQTCTKCKGTGNETKNQRTPFGHIYTSRTCPTCRGSGLSRKRDCIECKNTGQLYVNEECQVNIPPGTKPGTTLKIHGKGNLINNKRYGDLFVKLRSNYNSDEYIRDDCVITVCRVPYTRMILGGEISVLTFNGDLTINIPKGSQNDEEIFLKNYNNIKHYIKLRVVLPTNPSQNEIKSLNEINNQAT